ncbi:MAG: hypothetical protein E7623_04385 [Ruminococcaceae bacterium]|nr:hypothetical protein [Oscillospiraceae bacterium]
MAFNAAKILLFQGEFIMSETMKAVVVVGPHDVQYKEIPVPELRPYDVLARVKYIGICGTDIEIVGGEMSLIKEGLIKYPVRIGHEWTGVVERVGSAVTELKPGDRVMSDTWVSCGECDACHEGRYIECKSRRALGTVNAWDGAYAKYIRLPWWQYHKLADNVSLEEAALIEPTSIAYHAVERTRIIQKPGFAETANAVVFGTGPIGIAAVAVLKAKGTKNVIMVGRKDNKLEVAKQMGADAVIKTGKDVDTVKAIKDLTGGKGADVIIETSGANQCLVDASKSLWEWGELATLAFYPGPVDGIDYNMLVNNCNNIYGVGGQTGVPDILNMLEKGTLNLKPLVSHRFKFDEVADVLMNADRYSADKIKMLVDMSEDE